MSKKSKSHLDNVSMFSFGRAVLLVCMRTRNMMCNSYFLKERIKFLIFTSPICLHSNNFSVKLSFNKLLEVEKHFKHIGPIFKKENPCKFTKIINETYIVLIMTDWLGCRPPNIWEDQLQGKGRLNNWLRIWQLMTLGLLTSITNWHTRILNKR